MDKAEEIIKQINEMVDKPFVTAQFGDHWKEHTKKMLEVGMTDIDSVINIAWIHGRRALLMEMFITEHFK